MISSTQAVNTHTVYYRNYMNSSYKKYEQALREIIKDNIKVKNASDRVKLIIYYKTQKTRDIFMKNNLGPKLRDLAKTHAVYEFKCNIGECQHLPRSKTAYPGLTTCTLSRRLSYHLQNGAILKHSLDAHGRKITRKEIVDSTRIRYIERDWNRLEILESIIINDEDPEINRQDTGKRRILKLYGISPTTRPNE